MADPAGIQSKKREDWGIRPVSEAFVFDGSFESKQAAAV
jgi:hypothetical protein